MSDFLKFAYELIAQIIYNLAAFLDAFIKLLFTGWVEYFVIFNTYFHTFGIVPKILAVVLLGVVFAIPVLLVWVLVRRFILHRQLKSEKSDSSSLYREIGRLNKQVLTLIDEKNKILSLKVNAMGGTQRIPYMGASALTDDVLPTVANITSGTAANVEAVIEENALASAVVAATAAAQKSSAKNRMAPGETRFPKLALVDEKYQNIAPVEYNNTVTLEDFAEGYRLFAASKLKLYYTPEIIRRFIAGMAASKILILEGISGTGKTSLPYSFSRYMCNPATIVSVQPSFRDRTELLGYFNEFSKRFNETEFLRALYEANYVKTPSLIVLDEMNLARIEYYFAEMLSILEMPSKDEWVIDLVPTEWEGDPAMLNAGKINISDAMWFIGTANNDDSTFTITDKVYDRAIPIELNQRADSFECEETPSCNITTEHLQTLFANAKVLYPVSDETVAKMVKLDNYLQTRFKLAFGNRIMKQMYEFIPVYVACGGSELDGMDYIMARKVLKKFESMNIGFVRDEIKGLVLYIEKVFGKNNMQDSKSYLQRIQNLY